jgi:hypothetical protein
MAGEKSGSLVEVLERYIGYQKLSLAVRKKVMVSLLYPLLLISAAALLIVFLVVFVVPNFAELYKSMGSELPMITQLLIVVGTTARNYVLVGVGGHHRDDFPGTDLGETRIVTGDHRSVPAARAAVRGYVDQVSGRAVRPGAEHAVDGRHPAGSGS